MNAYLLVPAAGLGKRLLRPEPKALVDLAGEPLLIRTLRRFAPLGLVRNAVVMVPLHHEPGFRAAIDRAFPGAQVQLCPGGAERQHSVARGLDALATDDGVVVIHDAARPFVDPDTVREAISEARKHGAATVATPCVDTILHASKDQFLEDTPDRSRLWACQTPQVFRIGLLREAHRRAAAEGRIYTDDATLVLAHGAPVRIVAGSPRNFKVTTPEDLRYAEFLIKETAT